MGGGGVRADGSLDASPESMFPLVPLLPPRAESVTMSR